MHRAAQPFHDTSSKLALPHESSDKMQGFTKFPELGKEGAKFGDFDFMTEEDWDKVAMSPSACGTMLTQTQGLGCELQGQSASSPRSAADIQSKPGWRGVFIDFVHSRCHGGRKYNGIFCDKSCRSDLPPNVSHGIAEKPLTGLHLVKCLASTQGPKVRVNAILPGLLLTEWVKEPDLMARRFPVDI